MKKTRFIAVGFCVASLGLQACSHDSTEKKVDQELAQESPTTTRSEIRSEATHLIKTAPGLTEEQRAQLQSLKDTTQKRMSALREESLKLRSILVKDLITTHYNENEVELIKKKIKGIEDQRLAATFDAVEKANTILGRQAQDNRPVIEDFWEGRGSSAAGGNR